MVMERYPEGKHALPVESLVDLEQPPEALDSHTGGGQQQDREGSLHYYQRGEEATSPHGASVRKVPDQLRIRGSQRRKNGDQDRRQNGEGRGEHSGAGTDG